MSLTGIFIKLLGAFLAFIGFALLCAAVGLVILPVSFVNPWLSIIAGVVFLGGGIYIVQGGRPTV